ncbi:MAG: hypothetical protein RLZZ180_2288 [Pseudomonadota bacterium]|jgi:predicted nucleotidyltransferase
MRLRPDHLDAIRSACGETLPQGARLLLFGSRLDDTRLGGDIDLLVELPQASAPSEMVDRRTRLAARLYRRLGEQRIDILMTVDPQADGGTDDRPVVQEARRRGVELWRG